MSIAVEINADAPARPIADRFVDPATMLAVLVAIVGMLNGTQPRH